MSIVSKEDLLNKQAEAKNTLESFTCRILVCSGTGCIASGAQKIYEEMKVLCREDCKGLCPKCGRNLNEGPCGCDLHEEDPRWDALKGLLQAKNKV